MNNIRIICIKLLTILFISLFSFTSVYAQNDSGEKKPPADGGKKPPTKKPPIKGGQS